ncbi:MAG: transposase [Pseudomonadota bacterium]|nr:transposase [Pseudomonadota bacterium]
MGVPTHFTSAGAQSESHVATTGYEYAVLVISTDHPILTIAQLYRDRADAENNFDELKNQWGWGGFTTHDLKRCRLIARNRAAPRAARSSGDKGGRWNATAPPAP